MEIPDSKEELKSRAIRSSLEDTSTEPYFRWGLHLQLFSIEQLSELTITDGK